ncbi:MAG: DUF3710 domain-containing protein [Actinomycetes bacterium]
MSLLRRKRDEPDAGGADAAPADAVEQPSTDDLWPAEEKSRPEGPFDVDDVDDDLTRIDFGALRIPAVDGMEIRLDVDDEGRVGAVAVVLAGTALQLQVFAAPRTLTIWDEIRAEMLAGITETGGKAQETVGPFGPELVAQLPVDGGDGKPTVQPVRFLGVDGPRWFLRGVVTGPGGVDVDAAGDVHHLFRNVVVVRGDSAAPPREPLLLTMPEDPALQPDEGAP